MKRTKRVNWKNGDIFLIPLGNGKYALGQALDLQMPNVVRCLLFDDTIDDAAPTQRVVLDTKNIISKVACSKEQLDFGLWPIIGNAESCIAITDYPNEQFRHNGWIGSAMYDSAIIEEFVDAFHALRPWDDWANPDFLDGLLISKDKKPPNLVFSKK